MLTNWFMANSSGPTKLGDQRQYPLAGLPYAGIGPAGRDPYSPSIWDWLHAPGALGSVRIWTVCSGSLAPESQRQIRFSGWVGLVQAVTDLVTTAESGSGEMPGGLRGEPGARRDLELPEDAAEMRRDRSLRDEEARADLPVREALRH